MEHGNASPSPPPSSIRVISITTVYPDQPSNLGRLHLAFFDLRMLAIQYLQKGLLFAKPSSTHPSSDALLTHLRSSLSRALSFFPPLAGRLSVDPHDNAIFVACNDAGVEFAHAIASDLLMADLAARNLDVPDVTEELFRLNEVIGIEGQFFPLLSVQVTELADGVFVGCSCNHAVADGTSFWSFFKAWSELCRGCEKISNLPDFRRDDSTMIPPSSTIPGGDSGTIRFAASGHIRDRFFRFSGEAIKKLRARANSYSGAAKGEVSSFQSLCSQLWRSVTRARKRNPETETTLVMVASCRHRMHPPLSPHYFGNAILPIATTAKGSEVLGKEVGWCAELLRGSVTASGDEWVRKELKKFEEKRELVTIGRSSDKRPMVVILSSPRFAVYENDMGWGRPAAVVSWASNKFDGYVLAFPGREGGGSVDLQLYLAPATMAALLADGEFMQYVTRDGKS